MRPRLTSAPSVTHALSYRALALCALALSACGTPPPTHFHTLMPGEVSARPAGAASAPSGATAVNLEPIRVPAQVDQPQWVVRFADDTVAVLEQERWTSSLRDELREALLEELIVSHGMVDAHTVPAPASPPWRIAIDVRRFDSLPGREARLEGSWTITGGVGARTASRCEWLWREPAGPGMTGLADAHRRALSRLADAVAQAVSRAQRGETPACPALDEQR
jgi:uncharacterized lipoprotein YmbA